MRLSNLRGKSSRLFTVSSRKLTGLVYEGTEATLSIHMDAMVT
jgi:hypothetical protein